MIDVLSIIVLLVIIGFGLWLLEQIPMDATVKKVIIGVAIFLVIIWVLQSLGIVGSLRLK